MGRRRQLGSVLTVLATLGVVGMAPEAAAQVTDAETLLVERCGACHLRQPDGELTRIHDMRKTPEGWDMTLVRMMVAHDVELTPDERRMLVKHLADTQGLAPQETEGYRWALERRPNILEDYPDEELGVMCARCHSFARVALQRRTPEEWVKLSHFHVGQWPTTEYQALGRDRNWWEIASTQVPAQLAELYPLDVEAWEEWREREAPDLAGTWRVVGRYPGVGSYEGTATLSGTGDDTYDLEIEVRYADGRVVQSAGAGILYTGYEWRAVHQPGDRPVLEAAAVSEDGNEITGRWFYRDIDSIGGEIHAVRMRPEHAEILAVDPPYLRSGEAAEIAVHGVGLEGEVDLGPGVEIVETISESPETIVVRAEADADLETGARDVAVGEVSAAELFVVYERVDSIRIEPDYAIARVGGGDGPLPRIPAQFEAVAYANGPDGEPGTEDDIRIGVMDAEWSVEPFDEVAEAMGDLAFAGEMHDAGMFVPAEAGPNPARQFSTNNIGNLTVRAVVDDAGRAVEGTAQLIVTVQRWNDPPIR